MLNREKEILRFWFGDFTDETELSNDSPRVKKWFREGKQQDEEVRRLFKEDVLKASRGEYAEWKKTASGRMALTLLLDQFPRHIYRNQPESFSFDDKAVDLCQKSIVEKWDEKLKLIERAFFYLPLMHAEDIKIQNLSLKQYRILAEIAKTKYPINEDYYFQTLDFALKHHSIIQRFGRFPYRNPILGRTSTPEEIEYLKGPDDF